MNKQAILVNYSYSIRDHEAIKKMFCGITQSAVAMGVTLDATPLTLRPTGSDMHESCTCRMGENPDDSATNPNGQIHGVPGLYVADNSVLPTLAATNPTLPTVALTIRLADYI